MRIYIAGPISKGNRIENLRNAIEAADRVAKRGHFPFIPNLYDLWSLTHPENDYEFWMTQDFCWLGQCHAIIRLPGDSAGADREVSEAYEKGLLVFHGLDEFMDSEYWVPKEEVKEAEV